MHVLILEPDIPLGDIYSKAFRIEGYSVDLARTAQQAVILADKNKPDLVIAELQLKQHNGVAFLHEFRSYSDWSDVPIIINTVMFKKAFSDMGVVEIFYKPEMSLKKLVGCADKLFAKVKTS
jgi:DNA-binding response OmpR family regulator